MPSSSMAISSITRSASMTSSNPWWKRQGDFKDANFAVAGVVAARLVGKRCGERALWASVSLPVAALRRFESVAAIDVGGLPLIGDREIRLFATVCLATGSGVVVPLRCERKDLGARSGKAGFEGEDNGRSNGDSFSVEALDRVSTLSLGSSSLRKLRLPLVLVLSGSRWGG